MYTVCSTRPLIEPYVLILFQSWLILIMFQWALWINTSSLVALHVLSGIQTPCGTVDTHRANQQYLSSIKYIKYYIKWLLMGLPCIQHRKLTCPGFRLFYFISVPHCARERKKPPYSLLTFAKHNLSSETHKASLCSNLRSFSIC